MPIEPRQRKKRLQEPRQRKQKCEQQGSEHGHRWFMMFSLNFDCLLVFARNALEYEYHLI